MAKLARISYTLLRGGVVYLFGDYCDGVLFLYVGFFAVFGIVEKYAGVAGGWTGLDWGWLYLAVFWVWNLDLYIAGIVEIMGMISIVTNNNGLHTDPKTLPR